MKQLDLFKDNVCELNPSVMYASCGSKAMNNAELLSIILGMKDNEYCNHLMNNNNNSWHALEKNGIIQLIGYNEMTVKNARKIKAIFELARRWRTEDVKKGMQMNSAERIAELMYPIVQHKETEEAHVILMNQDLRLIKRIMISSGGISETAVDIRIIIKEAVINNATAIALVHNHPSGSTRPSQEDDRLTKKVNDACKLMRIRLIDHVIIGDSFYSYRINGLL